MDTKILAQWLFPNLQETPEMIEQKYPSRALPEGAKVTRLAPSPTGFIHLGNLYGAFADERLAHQSQGVFLLRIEDTDQKREVPGAVEALLEALAYFDVKFDEGATTQGDWGGYGPYWQRQRALIYQTFAKKLVEEGRAYPCFCTEEKLTEIRQSQAEKKENYGYYGPWALHRDLPMSDIRERLDRGEPFVIRLRSQGNPQKYFTIEDGIRGKVSMPENQQDVVLLKADGIPTYHFAHVVDDHLMGITHIVRGEEWLSTLPYHVEIFQALNWQPPVFCHTTVLMKMDEGVKRKLSKRKDPELGLDYYRQLGYHPQAVREYLMTVLNSNYEEWRLANPDAPLEEFPFTTEKMGSSGALFDLDKLNDVSKETLAKMESGALTTFFLEWAKAAEPQAYSWMADRPEYLQRALNIGRSGDKPRKDLIYGRQILDFIRFFYDELFVMQDAFPEQIHTTDARAFLEAYIEGYASQDPHEGWFDHLKSLSERFGFAAKPKDFKKNPEAYKGHVGDLSSLLRVALTGRRNAPDLWEIQQILGAERVLNRLKAALESL